MKFFPIMIAFCLTALIIPGCTERIDPEDYRQELLSLNETMRTAHLEGDAETIIASHDYPYFKVNTGHVSFPTREENDRRFQNYMSTMNVAAWDDLMDPIVIISDDASLATVIYRKHLSMVPVAQPDAEPYEGIYAWQSTYRRTPEGWKQISDILTTLPEEELIEELKTLKE